MNDLVNLSWLVVPLSIRFLSSLKATSVKTRQEESTERLNDLIFYFKTMLSSDKGCLAYADCRQCPDHVPRNIQQTYSREKIKAVHEEHFEVSPEIEAAKIEAHLQEETKRKAKEVRAHRRAQAAANKKAASSPPSDPGAVITRESRSMKAHNARIKPSETIPGSE